MLQAILSTILSVNVPLAVPVVCGVLLARLSGLDAKPLLAAALYVLNPALIFQTLSSAQLAPGDVPLTLAFAAANMALMWVLAKASAKALGLPAPETAGLTLIGTVTNCVNYGLPLVLLAFGQLGLDKASVYVIIQIVFVNTAGVFLAARSRFSGLGALASVFRLPAVYAALLALAFRCFGLHLPQGLGKGVAMLAQAYSPVVLIILGVQMARVKTEGLAGIARRAFWSGMALRMAAAPLAAFGLCALLDIHGMLRSVLIIEASMPVAVNSVILAEKFDAAPKTLSACILWTTLASFIYLPALILLVM